MTIAGTGVAAGVPITVIVSAVLGAMIAVNRGERVELTARGLWSTLLVFACALAFGVFGGRLLGVGFERALLTLFRLDLAGLGAQELFALTIALLSQSVIVPALARRLGMEIVTRGAGPSQGGQP